VDEAGALVYQNRRAATAPDFRAEHSPFMLVRERTAAVAPAGPGGCFVIVQTPAAAAAAEAPPPCVQRVVEEQELPQAGAKPAPPPAPALTVRVFSSLTRHPVVERVLDSTAGLHMWVNSVGPGAGMEFVTT
jgi:hypothetical protein